MTIGISKERLEELFDDFIVNDMLLDDFRSLVISGCKELNPWLPIDENTPKTRKVLLFYASDKQQVIGWVTAHPQATHYQELPEDPKE